MFKVNNKNNIVDFEHVNVSWVNTNYFDNEVTHFRPMFPFYTQPIFNFSKLTIEKIEQDLKYVQS